MSTNNVRDKLISAGLALLHQKGYHATGVQDIADAAGVPKGSFYNHFKSKELLGVAIVEVYGSGSPRRRSLSDVSVPPMQRLRAYLVGVNDDLTANNFSKGCLLANLTTEMSDHSEMIRERLLLTFNQWTADLSVVIAAAQMAHEIPEKRSANELAYVLLNAWEGAIVRSRVERDRRALDLFVTMVFEDLLA